MSTSRYFIPHQPGTSIMFNLKKALRQKKQKDRNGDYVYAESWIDNPTEMPLTFRLQRKEFPYLVGHHGHREIFCGQALSYAKLSEISSDIVHIAILNNTNRGSCGPIPRPYVFVFHSNVEAKCFVMSMNEYINDNQKEFKETKKVKKSDDDKARTKRKCDDHDEVTHPPLKKGRVDMEDKSTEDETVFDVDDDDKEEGGSDEIVFDDDAFANTQDPYSEYHSD